MAEPFYPSTGTTRAAQDRPLPSFICVLPCTNPTVKYGDRLDGCASGIHVTLEDTKDLQVLYDRMAEEILAKGTPPLEQEVDPKDPCAVCLVPMVPSSSTPVMYLEKCVHRCHYYCIEEDRSFVRGNGCPFVSCSSCRTESNRSLFWPQVFGTTTRDAERKNEIFQLQKRCFGIDVAPETALQVHCACSDDEFPDLRFNIKAKYFYLRQRRPLPPSPPVAPSPVQPPERVAPAPGQVTAVARPQPYIRADHEYVESTVVQAIQELHLADQPRRFYLGDILPMQENPQYQALHGPRPPLREDKRREALLLQFWCPFDRVNVRPGQQCKKGQFCEFFHGWPQNTPAYIKQRVMVRHFPSYFCIHHTRFPGFYNCIERIRVNSQDLARCSNCFHPTFQDLKDPDGFACKMAKQIMSPVVVPEPSQHLVCSFCRKSAEPNSIWIHMQNCAHCVHVDCLPLVRHNYRHLNRKLDIHCPACQVPSVRAIAWPGPFPSNMVKQTIFERQLYEFKLHLSSDTQVTIVQVANKPNLFTVDYGGPRVVTIDWTWPPDRRTIWFD